MPWQQWSVPVQERGVGGVCGRIPAGSNFGFLAPRVIVFSSLSRLIRRESPRDSTVSRVGEVGCDAGAGAAVRAADLDADDTSICDTDDAALRDADGAPVDCPSGSEREQAQQSRGRHIREYWFWGMWTGSGKLKLGTSGIKGLSLASAKSLIPLVPNAA